MQFYQVKTQHYAFTLQVEEKHSPYHVITFFVGKDKHRACLDLHAFFPDINERLLGYIEPTVASLEKIEGLEECSYFELTEDYMEKYSFGKEILYAIVSIVSLNLPHIKTFKLNDKSVIPCNRANGDTLDLLTYSIALYGKTWYEKTFNAYIFQKDIETDYKNKINKFISEKYKKNVSFDDIQLLPTIHNNRYAELLFQEKNIEYKRLYMESKTLPEFFKALNDTIPRKEKCIFFKSWLEKYIGSIVTIHREWRFDIYNNEKFATVLSNIRPKSTLRVTRKRKDK